MAEKFMYFAFGSNLKTKRVQINSPSAEFVGWAKLSNYRLAFGGHSERWHGGIFLFSTFKLRTYILLCQLFL